MGDIKNIFKSHGLLTEDEIRRYLAGDVTKAEKHQIELKIESSAMNRDAVEGYAAANTVNLNTSKLDDYISTKTSVTKKLWKWQYTVAIAMIAGLGVSFLAPLFFTQNKTVQNQKDTVEIAETPLKTLQTEQEKIPLIEQDTILLNEIDISSAVEIPLDQQISDKDIVAKSPIHVSDETILDSAIFLAEIEKIQQIKIDVSPISAPTLDDLVYVNAPLTYIQNYLMLDYRKIPQNNALEFSVTTLVLKPNTGTSANLENDEDLPTEVDFIPYVTEVTPYLEYISLCQQSLKAQDYKNTLKLYQALLKQYPEDLNAIFYSGIALYNLGKYKKALSFFSKAKNHYYNVFSIDAEWYMAKSYYELGKLESSKKILTEIINKGNYYSKKAEQLLKELP